MAQGWNVSASAHNITFFEAPAPGAAIVVNEYATSAQNATDLWALGAWSPAYGYPREVEYFGDRKWYAGSRKSPQGLWASRVGAYLDFGKSSPIQDDDSLAVTINSRQANEIRDLVPLKQLIVMTSAGELVVSGGQDEVITPSSIAIKPQTYNGTSKIPSVVVGNTAIFLQDRGYIMRDLSYTFASDDYSGNNLTVFANHLVEGHQIIDVAYQQVPHSIIWMVRDDGVLLGLTYMREQEVIGWSHSDTDGFYESVACISEGGEDILYVVVRRLINGTYRRYIERMESRLITDQKKAFFVDAGLSYDGTNTTSATMRVTGGTLWNNTEGLTLTSSIAEFTAGSVGTWIVLNVDSISIDASSGLQVTKTDSIRLLVTGYTSTTVVSVNPIGTVPASLRGVATADWSRALRTFAGLGHLEGKTVSILSDGNVEPQKVVNSGSVTLERPGSIVIIGMPFVSDFETLEVNVIGQETVRDRKKLIGKVTLIVSETRDVKVAANLGSDSFEEYPARGSDQNYLDPAQLLSDTATVNISASWSDSGRVAVRHDQPLPITILGVIPEVTVGG